MALQLAGGDVRRLHVLDAENVIVHNSPRKKDRLGIEMPELDPRRENHS
jgi:hypothetical protein